METNSDSNLYYTSDGGHSLRHLCPLNKRLSKLLHKIKQWPLLDQTSNNHYSSYGLPMKMAARIVAFLQTIVSFINMKKNRSLISLGNQNSGESLGLKNVDAGRTILLRIVQNPSSLESNFPQNRFEMI